VIRWGIASLFITTTVATATPQIAIVGDSISTGAAAHPSLTYDPVALWEVFSGQTDLAGAEAPTRLWPSPREFGGGPEWVFHNAMQTVSRRYLDAPQLSWGALVANELQIQPKDVLLAAENGSRVATLPRQIDRVLAANGGALPPKVFVFFTGNDLCGPNISYVTEPEAFEASLYDGLQYARRAARPAPEGTTIHVVSYLSVLQLLHAEPILQKKIKSYGKERTCAELRAAAYRPQDEATTKMQVPPEAWSFAMMMPPNPSAYCPTLFGGSTRDPKAQEELIGQLANRIRAYRDAAKRVVERAQTALASTGDGAGGMSFRFVSGTGELIFGADDIAADCFHLSAAGQARVAAAVLAELND
jgi:lysophospholipase L1-like esterase